MLWLPLPKEKKEILANQEVIVIMGRGHSGTRIMTRICESLGINTGATADLKTGDTADLKFTRSIKKIAIQDIDCNFGKETKDGLQNRFDRAADRYFRRLQPTGPWGWKFPETYLIGPYVHHTFPRARYVHLIRDGRDLAFKDHLTDDPNRKLGQVLLSHLDALDKPHHLQAALSWEFQMNAWESFAASLPPGSVIDFRFEDLLKNPEKTVGQLTDFLGVEMTHSCRYFLETELDTSKARQHRENDPEKVREVVELIGDTLKKYDYLA